MAVNAEINVVSLIDVMMLLMIVFMIAAPMMQGGVDVQLPKADVQPLDAKSGVIVSIDRDGRIFIDRAEVSLDELAGTVKSLMQQKRSEGVYVRTDEQARSGVLVRVFATLISAGVENVGLVGEPLETRR
jgi:biopolymer transport protein ExbD